MPTTVTTLPTYAVPKRPARVIFTPANGNCNYVRVWVTQAPEGTAFRKAIDANKLNRHLAYAGPVGTAHPWLYTFEVGGSYTLKIQEYERGNGWGGGYDGDPRGAPYETQLGSEQSLTLYISQRFTMPLGTSENSARLVLFVNNDTIVTTSRAVHGESAPNVIEPSSNKAETAAQNATLLAEVAAFGGRFVSTELMSLGTSFHLKTLLSELRTAWGAHIANSGGTYHDVADTDNVIPDEVAPAGVDLSPEQAAQSCIEMLNRMRRHFLNDNGEGIGSATYHPVPDAANLPIIGGINDVAGAYAAYGDMRRAYVAHIANATVHSPADSANVLAAIGGENGYRLAQVHTLFMTQLAAVTPTTPPTSSGGATWLTHQAGMVEG